MLTCPLCERLVREFHKRSHILPEWMYTDCYDDRHKVLEMSRAKKKITKKQKGVYAEFICRKCEKETQKDDHYASLILTDRSPESPEYRSVKRKRFKEQYENEILEFERWENVEFKKLQKFVLSGILRTHFSRKVAEYSLLNPLHLNRMLAVYRDDSINDDSSYPIMVIKIPEKDILRNQVVLPYIKRHEGHRIVEFTGAGFLFNVYMSSHKKPQFVNSLRLKSDGSMFLISMFFRETGLFKNTKRLIKTVSSAY